MPEPVTTVGLGAIAAYLGKDGLQKLLGPTADYLGAGLRDFTQRRTENIVKIFESAEKKLGERLDGPGEVPPKVLKSVLNEGSYATEAIAVEYFGGILASSRTEQGRDDRGARLAKLLDGLSTYQLRAHYLIYATVHRIFSGRALKFNMEGRPKMQIFIPFDDFFNAMDFNGKEMQQIGQLLNHVFFGLHSDNLIEGEWQYGPHEHIAKMFSGTTSVGGILCGPSVLGAELFLSAFGQCEKPVEEIFNSEMVFIIDGVPEGFLRALPTKM